jgi:uncharacterized protein (TIGR03437 family)
VKRKFAIVLAFGLFAALAYAQPTITQISNAATFVLPPPASESTDTPLPNSGIAQGSFFAIFGSNLGPSTVQTWGTTYPLPKTLGGTTVSVTVGGTTMSTLIYFTSAGQINAVMPSAMPTGTGTLTVSYGGATSSATPVTVVASSFGTFTKNEAGSGPGWFYNVSSSGAATVNSPVNTAVPGQTITVFGTGLSALPSSQISSEGNAAPTATNLISSNFLVDVWVGNQQATVSYAGRSGYTAEDQINFTIPSGVTGGCYVNVAIYAGPSGNQKVSNFTSLAIDPNGAPCADADGISASDFSSALSSKGSVNVGAIGLLSSYLSLTIIGEPVQIDSDSVSGEFGTFSEDVLEASQGVAQLPSVNSCTVANFEGLDPVPTDPELKQVTGLDAGSSVTIKGPNGSGTATESSTSTGTYSGSVGGAPLSQVLNDLLSGVTPPGPFFLSPSGFSTISLSNWPSNVSTGSYTVSGPGGSAVGSFSQAITVSTPLTWTNESIVNNPVSRSQNLTITWTGGGSGFLDITGIASTSTGSNVPKSGVTPGVLFECVAPASAGTFTVPSVVLQALPATPPGSLGIPFGFLLVGEASTPVQITPTPSGLDAAFVFYRLLSGTFAQWE